LTYVTVASIPILVLRKTRMKLKQKFSLGIFLCLSFVMAIFALIRVGGLKRGSVVDNTWSLFWQYAEGCVACIMASITPFRTLFVGPSTYSSHRKRKGPSTSLRNLWRKPTKDSEEVGSWEEMRSNNPLPKPPAALISGLRTFIRRNNRESGETTVLVTNTFQLAETTTNDPGEDYRNYLRNATGVPRSR